MVDGFHLTPLAQLCMAPYRFAKLVTLSITDFIMDSRAYSRAGFTRLRRGVLFALVIGLAARSLHRLWFRFLLHSSQVQSGATPFQLYALLPQFATPSLPASGFTFRTL